MSSIIGCIISFYQHLITAVFRIDLSISVACYTFIQSDIAMDIVVRITISGYSGPLGSVSGSSAGLLVPQGFMHQQVSSTGSCPNWSYPNDRTSRSRDHTIPCVLHCVRGQTICTCMWKCPFKTLCYTCRLYM